jgi:16S rRNA (adenine1518-N6/adenine1519-N6)-dimethyltransferase
MPSPPSGSPIPESPPAGARPPGRAEILALLEGHGLRASRALGQNFLADPNVAERIARLACVAPGDDVLEIGPGLGSLTVALARAGAHVLAVELDRHLLPALGEVVAGLDVDIVHADAMETAWRSKLAGRTWTLVANLPYNIATPLVLDYLEHEPLILRMLVMVQREVGERLAAAPSSPAYGAVSARVAYFATAKQAMAVAPSVFVPRPNVDSVIVDITRRPEVAVDPDAATYEEINVLISRAFAQRRKMLRRTLAPLVPESAFEAAGIASTRRPEELGIVEWGRLAVEAKAGGPDAARAAR